MKQALTEPSREQKFRVLLLSAMTRPLALAVLVITASVALLINYWFALVGLLFYALLVYSTLQDAKESREVLNKTFYPERVRNLDLRKLSGGYRQALQRAMETRKRIESAVAATADVGMRKALLDSTDDLEEMVGTIYDLALKAQSLQASLQGSNINVTALNDEISRLERIVASTEDEFSRNQYEATLEGRRHQLRNYTDTTDALNRWHAQLDNALTTLDTILSQVLRIRSSEVLQLSTATDEVSRSLREEVEALKATSDALDSVYGLSR